jgi:putative flippase GtrA
MSPNPSTLIRQLWARRFVRFLFAGGVAAAVNIASRIGFSQAMGYGWAILAAYLCGMTTAWALSRLLVFERSGGHWTGEYGRFALVNVVAAAQVWVISVGLERWVFPALGFTFYPLTVAHAIGVVVPVFTSYAGHRHFSFGNRGRPGLPQPGQIAPLPPNPGAEDRRWAP